MSFWKALNSVAWVKLSLPTPRALKSSGDRSSQGASVRGTLSNPVSFIWEEFREPVLSPAPLSTMIVSSTKSEAILVCYCFPGKCLVQFPIICSLIHDCPSCSSFIPSSYSKSSSFTPLLPSGWAVAFTHCLPLLPFSPCFDFNYSHLPVYLLLSLYAWVCSVFLNLLLWITVWDAKRTNLGFQLLFQLWLLRSPWFSGRYSPFPHLCHLCCPTFPTWHNSMVSDIIPPASRSILYHLFPLFPILFCPFPLQLRLYHSLSQCLKGFLIAFNP